MLKHSLLCAIAVLAVMTGRESWGAPIVESANVAYMKAKAAQETLKADPAKRKYRDQWLTVIGRFNAVAQRYPKSPRAPEALFNVGNLHETLSRISLTKDDVRLALVAYGQLTDKYPNSYLADDAHLAVARIHRDRRGDSARAIVSLKAAIAVKGDLSATARAELKALEVAPAAKPPGEIRPAPKPPPEPAPGPANARRVKEMAKVIQPSEISLSTQMGLKVKRVVIDPGHGGHDPGALGKKGTKEKDITLAIAKKLKSRLERLGFEVLMTRDTDVFLALESRTRFANASRGDLFISIHCNASPNDKTRGAETYTLNLTSDRYAIRLAARENASSEKAISDLQYILADLATKANTDDSTRLAKTVQAKLAAQARDLGVKQALFYVLLGAKMPAILVETAFLSNAEDEVLLANPAQQSRLAEAISDGVVRFATDRSTFVAGP